MSDSGYFTYFCSNDDSPDEYAFTSPLPEPILPPVKFKQFLAHNDINVNDKIMDIYVKSIVTGICDDHDDNNYGSSATKDIDCLQALSRRIHYGKAPGDGDLKM